MLNLIPWPNIHVVGDGGVTLWLGFRRDYSAYRACRSWPNQELVGHPPPSVLSSSKLQWQCLHLMIARLLTAIACYLRIQRYDIHFFLEA